MREFLEETAEILETDVPGPDFELRSAPMWGSMAAFALCLLVERLRGRPMTAAELKTCRTAGDLAAAAGVE